MHVRVCVQCGWPFITNTYTYSDILTALMAFGILFPGRELHVRSLGSFNKIRISETI